MAARKPAAKAARKTAAPAKPPARKTAAKTKAPDAPPESDAALSAFGKGPRSEELGRRILASLAPSIAGRVTGVASVDPETGLTAQQERFAVELAKGLNQSEAYRAAFPRSMLWRQSAVHCEASKLAGNTKVIQRVAALRAEARKAHGFEVTDALANYVRRVNADPTELTGVRVSACRRCWGDGHMHQYTDGELQEAQAEHALLVHKCEVADKPPPPAFHAKGGGGYSRSLPPNPDCPSCAGDGVPRVYVRDSSKLSEGARSLFIAAKEGKDGLEVKVSDRMEALMQLARHVDFFEADNSSSVNVTATPEELDAIYDAAKLKLAEREAMANNRRAIMGALEERAGFGEAGDGRDPLDDELQGDGG